MRPKLWIVYLAKTHWNERVPIITGKRGALGLSTLIVLASLFYDVTALQVHR